jgi:hypothetical protein
MSRTLITPTDLNDMSIYIGDLVESDEQFNTARYANVVQIRMANGNAVNIDLGDHEFVLNSFQYTLMPCPEAVTKTRHGGSRKKRTSKKRKTMKKRRTTRKKQNNRRK